MAKQAEDKRDICPKCHKRVNKMRAITEEVFEWKGSRENGESIMKSIIVVERYTAK